MSETVCLDERLLKDGALLSDYPMFWLILKNEMHYPWFVVVPKTRHQSIDLLEEPLQLALVRGIGLCSCLIREIFKRPKINVASLGNVVPTLHVHVVGRQESDPLWPEGIWQKAYIPCMASSEVFHERCQSLQKALQEIEKITHSVN